MKGMTDKELAFCEEYIACLNGTEAMRRAHYGDEDTNDATLASMASEYLRKPKIRAYIARRLEKRAMHSNEVLARLTEMARADLRDFISVVGEGQEQKAYLDLAKGIEAGKGGLLKKVTFTTKHYGRGEDAITEERIEVELHDPQAALVHLGRHHKLFTDNHDLTSGGKPIQTIRTIEVVKDRGDASTN